MISYRTVTSNQPYVFPLRETTLQHNFIPEKHSENNAYYLQVQHQNHCQIPSSSHWSGHCHCCHCLASKLTHSLQVKRQKDEKPSIHQPSIWQNLFITPGLRFHLHKTRQLTFGFSRPNSKWVFLWSERWTRQIPINKSVCNRRQIQWRTNYFNLNNYCLSRQWISNSRVDRSQLSTARFLQIFAGKILFFRLFLAWALLQISPPDYYK